MGFHGDELLHQQAVYRLIFDQQHFGGWCHGYCPVVGCAGAGEDTGGAGTGVCPASASAPSVSVNSEDGRTEPPGSNRDCELDLGVPAFPSEERGVPARRDDCTIL
jgi:hypothetical protein